MTRAGRRVAVLSAGVMAVLALGSLLAAYGDPLMAVWLDAGPFCW